MKGNPRAKVDAEGVYRLTDENRPLLLLVSDNETRLVGVRVQLREAGYLVASSRSISAAISLLDQVRVDGCILTGVVTTADAERVAHALDRYTPNCPKIILQEDLLSCPSGWRAAKSEQMLIWLSKAFVSQ